jgi:hypothetical protein
MTTLKSLKIPTNYFCKFCYYNTLHLKDYNKHLLTQKHQNNENNVSTTSKILKKIYTCDKCNKIFNDRAGLWRHNKKSDCLEYIDKKDITKDITKDIIMTLIKDNSELKNMLIEQQNIMMKVIENTTTTNNNHINNNCMNNNTFNLQVFLNETCKNAMNISDFVESIKLQLSDLIHIGEVGYVEGISKIIVKNLNALDETERPVHCTDKKRETMYIKDANEWTKEDDNKTKLIKVIRTISNKNIKLLPQFREKYPEYKNSSSKISDTYDKMVIEAMVSDTNKDDKIIKNISKATIIK